MNLLRSPHQQHHGLSQHSHQQPTTISRRPLLRSPQHSAMHPLPQLRRWPTAKHIRACSLPGPRQALLHQPQPFEWASAASLQGMSRTARSFPMPPMDSQQQLLRVLTDPCMCSGDSKPTEKRPQMPCRPFLMSVPKFLCVQMHTVAGSHKHI